MPRINMNDLANRITATEGLKKAISIAQVKEVVRITLEELRRELTNGNVDGVMELLKRSER